MTCKVTITNNSDNIGFDNHVLEVTGGAGDKYTIGPGSSATTHVWIGAPIKIIEIEAKGEKRGNPESGYGAFPPAVYFTETSECEGCNEARKLFKRDPVVGRYDCGRHGPLN